MPGAQDVLVVKAGFDIDNRGGTEVGPGEFFFARPFQQDGVAGAARQTRCLDGSLTGVFAAEAAPEIGDDNSDAVIRNMERARQFPLVAKWILGAGPAG